MGIGADLISYSNVIFVDRKFNISPPVASGLSTEWVKAQKTKKGSTEVAHCVDDEAALSTRPDYPPSPTKFNRNVADAKFATARAKARAGGRSTRENTVRF